MASRDHDDGDAVTQAVPPGSPLATLPIPTAAPAGARAPAMAGGTFASLAYRDYAWLFVGQTASSLAMNMQMVARGWLVYEMTSSPIKLAWVTLAFMLPQAVLSLYGGVLADRLSKRRIQVVAQALNCAATIAMSVIILSGNASYEAFIAFGFFNGTVLALSMPARAAMIPDLVPAPLVFNAMALSTTSMNLTRILGPLLAGVLIALLADGNRQSAFGVGIVYLAISAQYALSSVSGAMIRTRSQLQRRSRGSSTAQVREALRYVRRSPLVFGLIALSVLPFVFGMSLNTMLPAFNTAVLAGGPDTLGLLTGSMGGGAIVGSLLLGRMGNIGHKGAWLFGLAATWGLLVMIFALADGVPFACLAAACIGYTSSMFMSMNRGLLQLQLVPEMRGRVLSIDNMTHGLMPLGVLPISWLAEHQGIDVALLTSGAILAASTLLCALLLPQVRHIDKGYAPGPEAR
jgi:MFS family permease